MKSSQLKTEEIYDKLLDLKLHEQQITTKLDETQNQIERKIDCLEEEFQEKVDVLEKLMA